MQRGIHQLLLTYAVALVAADPEPEPVLLENQLALDPELPLLIPAIVYPLPIDIRRRREADSDWRRRAIRDHLQNMRKGGRRTELTDVQDAAAALLIVRQLIAQLDDRPIRPALRRTQQHLAELVMSQCNTRPLDARGRGSARHLRCLRRRVGRADVCGVRAHLQRPGVAEDQLDA